MRITNGDMMIAGQLLRLVRRDRSRTEFVKRDISREKLMDRDARHAQGLPVVADRPTASRRQDPRTGTLTPEPAARRYALPLYAETPVRARPAICVPIPTSTLQRPTRSEPARTQPEPARQSRLRTPSEASSMRVALALVSASGPTRVSDRPDSASRVEPDRRGIRLQRAPDGGAIASCRQIARAVPVGISRCRGTGVRRSEGGLCQMV